jgi:hypothetical protein
VPKKHHLAVLTDDVFDAMNLYDDTLGEFLAGGLLPFERSANKQEQLESWRALAPEDIQNMVAESPSKFLKYWDAMQKLEARNPLAPYLEPYGLEGLSGGF